MAYLLSRFFGILRRYLLVFGAIVLVIACGSWIRTEWKNIQGLVGELPSLRLAEANVREYQNAQTRRTVEGLRKLSGATVRQLDARMHAIDVETTRLRAIRDGAPLMLVAIGGSGAVAESLAQAARTKVTLTLLQQERDYLAALRAHVDALANRQGALNRLAQLHAAHVNAHAAYEGARKRRDAFRTEAGLSARLFFTGAHRQLQVLDREVADRLAANEAAHMDFVAQRALLDRLPSLTAPPIFQVNESSLAAAAAPLQDRLRQANDLAAENHLWQAYQAVRPVFPTAAWVFFGWLAVPAAIRAFFYFVLAPLAARRPPVVIGAPSPHQPTTPLRKSPAGGDARISAVSQQIVLTAGQELVLRPAYCQSQPTGVSVGTRFLFDRRRWLTSIAAHLWVLTRLRASKDAVVVVSSTVDPLEELALLDIAAGEAFVLQPRGLVGMLYRTEQRPRIRSHWRLGTLHAWLTLQLRYLSFEGPATLIVRGCRGVRLEPASTDRTVSQDATLGFSTGIDYATVRAEPFFPYLTGKRPLLQDRFTGQHGCYLYEEVPRSDRPGQRGRNPVEVLIDAALKAFGI